MFETPLSENWVISICSLRGSRISHSIPTVLLYSFSRMILRWKMPMSTRITSISAMTPGRWSRLVLPGTIGREVQREETITGSGQKDSYRSRLDTRARRRVLMIIDQSFAVRSDRLIIKPSPGESDWFTSLIQKRRSGEIKGSFLVPMRSVE
ncbi:hypothetical protein B0H14DRAFT_2856449 [Mycena olivaceomarginata]|nr:hypothetical protein B0H14DRAFT_2856449 [Mycena olivaceomarginata]